MLDTDAAGQRHVAVAASFNLSKIFVLDCATGLLHTALTSRQLRPAVPPDPLPPVTTRTMMATSRDGLLRWMEEYGSRLEGGMYRAQPLEPGMGDESLGMCLFPAAPPAQAAEVSAGVRVTASCIYVPEMSSTTEFQFAYSIRFALLPPEQQRPYREAAAAAAAASAAQNPGAPGGSSSSSSAPVPVMSPQPLECCQLMTRHWVIRDCDGAITNQVRGEAVIGKYPLLRAGGPEFVYQSCTAQSSSEVEPGRPGSMEGDFQFVEGTMQRPTGPTWPVICPRFQLALPDFVY